MVLNGLDCIEKYDEWFKKRRIGLITSPSGVNSRLESAINILHSGYELKALYSPEHGVRGDIEAGGYVENYTDPYTGIPVHSLYRSDSKRLTEAMLEGIDTLVYDMQDVGTRFYTFIYTMLYAMEDCAKYGKEFIVLDRINPLGGAVVEGNIIRDDFNSFIGGYSLCIRYGLTAGELALMINNEQGGRCDLKVVGCEGWRRSMLFKDTGLLWVMPSMGITSPDAALLYPGICLFEGTNISEGRGTSKPFEIIGAPFLDAEYLSQAMNKKGLPGVKFRPVHFKPFASKDKDILCHGVQIHILDPYLVRSVELAVSLLYEIQREYGDKLEFRPPYKDGSRPSFDLLAGDDRIRGFQMSEKELISDFNRDTALFEERKEKYHIYH